MSILATVLAAASALVNLAGAAILGLASQSREAFLFMLAALFSAAGALASTSDGTVLAAYMAMSASFAAAGFHFWSRPSEHATTETASGNDPATSGGMARLLVSLTFLLPATAALVAWLGS